MIFHRRAGSLFWLALGIYAAISGYRLGLGSFSQPGPGFIFFLMALVLITLSAIDLAITFVGKPRAGNADPDEPLWTGVRWQKILLLLVGMSVYVLVLNFLGFVLATLLLLIFLFKAVEPTKWSVSIIASIVTMSLCYGVFGIWLKVPFPQGILFS